MDRTRKMMFKKIIKTKQLEQEKSFFSIDLMKHESGFLYVEIDQEFKLTQKRASIKINPLILSDIIQTLQEFYEELPKNLDIHKKHITNEDQEIIVNRYLKGVSLVDIALQFDQNIDFIKMILRNKNIEITNNKYEYPRWKKYYRRKRK